MCDSGMSSRCRQGRCQQASFWPRWPLPLLPPAGTLPASWAAPGVFPSLVSLYLMGNYINGSLPASWTSGEGFPQLRTL